MRSPAISWVTLARESAVLLLWAIDSYVELISCSSYFSALFWMSIASLSSFLSWMRFEHSCSRFLSLSVSSSYTSCFSPKSLLMSFRSTFFALRVLSLMMLSFYLSRVWTSARHSSSTAKYFILCCRSISLYLASSLRNSSISAIVLSAVDFCFSFNIILFLRTAFPSYNGFNIGFRSSKASSSSTCCVVSIMFSRFILNFYSNFSVFFCFSSAALTYAIFSFSFCLKMV